MMHEFNIDAKYTAKANYKSLNPEMFGFVDTGKSLIKEIRGNKYSITPIKGMDELTEAVSLQQKVWELSDYDVCPPHMWVTAIDTGGHVLGVRDESGTLVAFAAGFGGYDIVDKHAFVLSDMAAVEKNLRDSNIGFALKLAQAIYVGDQGISEIRWTYDPLRSRNAYLNLHKLGAVVGNFYINKYGNSLAGSQNADITDRFLARWAINDKETQNKMMNQRPPTSIEDVDIIDLGKLSNASQVALEIPTDIDSLSRDQKVSAQLRFRELALTYIAERGYRCVDYATTGNHERGFYILRRE